MRTAMMALAGALLLAGCSNAAPDKPAAKAAEPAGDNILHISWAGIAEADAGEAKRHWTTWTINLVDGGPAYGWLSDKSVTLPHALNFELAGTGKIDDPAFLHFLAGTGPTLADPVQSQTDAQRAGAELLDLIGAAVVLSHSAGGPPGWLIADARPGLVKALVAMEPLGPPFTALSGPLPYGITNATLTYDPPLGEGETLVHALDQFLSEDAELAAAWDNIPAEVRELLAHPEDYVGFAAERVDEVVLLARAGASD